MLAQFGCGRCRAGFSLVLLALGLTAGCSVKKFAVNQLGNALAQGGSVYAAEDDPELVKAAAPFSLKLMESLLAESPRHPGLLQAAASGFTQYAYAFVQLDADELEESDLAAAVRLRARAAKLYLRARDYGLRALDARHRGFSAALRRSPGAAARRASAPDVPMLYWTAVSWAAAISNAKDNPDLVADLSVVSALIDRALALDPDYSQGAIHTFLIQYEVARPDGATNAIARAREHFARARALSGRKQSAPLVSLAEAVAIKVQNRAEFKDLLEQALAIDPAAVPETQLLNLIVQRRARWLLSRINDLFIEPETTK